MRILMVAPQPFFEPRGTPLSVLGRLKALSQLGHSVDLVTYHIGQDVAIQNVVVYRIPRIAFIKTISVGPSAKKLFLDAFLAAKTCKMLRKNRYDLLHTHEEASFFGILLAKVFRVKHLYDMHSSLPQQLGNFQYSRLKMLVRLFDWLERKVLRSCNGLITICPALEEHARGINNRVPHVMIENVASELSWDQAQDDPGEDFRVKYAVEGKKIILYAGTFESYQGIDLLIDSAEQVLKRRQDVFFWLIGGRKEQVRQYQKKIDRLGLSQFFGLTGTRPPGEIPHAVRLCHVLVSPRTSGTNTPLKIYAYLRSGKPIVATNLYTHTQVLNPDVAVLVKPQPDDMAKGLLSVLENPQLGSSLSRRAQELFESDYSFQKYLEKTEKILQMATA
jgi:glycosyltransferase involved in cell wall biosynthesis